MLVRSLKLNGNNFIGFKKCKKPLSDRISNLIMSDNPHFKGNLHEIWFPIIYEIT